MVIDVVLGKIETRKCYIITEFKESKVYQDWKNLETTIKIESIREFKNAAKITKK